MAYHKKARRTVQRNRRRDTQNAIKQNKKMNTTRMMRRSTPELRRYR